MHYNIYKIKKPTTFQIFNDRTGEAIGFIYGNDSSVASHVLVFMVVGLTPHNPLKFSLGYFGTKNATADTIYPLFWEAVLHLEASCKLKVSPDYT